MDGGIVALPRHLLKTGVDVRHLLTIAAMLSGLALLAPAAHAGPQVCAPDAIGQALIAAGKLTQDAIDGGEGVDLVRCGDVTGDGAADAVFTIASGGTAGDIRFGVLQGKADGSAGAPVLYRQGYKVGIARRDSRSFEVLQPHYGANDPNCCPSSFRKRRYTWNGTTFKAGAAQKLKTAPRKFYKQ